MIEICVAMAKSVAATGEAERAALIVAAAHRAFAHGKIAAGRGEHHERDERRRAGDLQNATRLRKPRIVTTVPLTRAATLRGMSTDAVVFEVA